MASTAIQKIDVLLNLIDHANINIGQDGAVQYTVLDAEHEIEICAELLTDAFTARTEPLAFSRAPRHFKALCTYYLHLAIQDKTSVIAWKGNEMVGICLNNDLTDEPEETFVQNCLDRDLLGFGSSFQVTTDSSRAFIDEMKAKQSWQKNVIFNIFLMAVKQGSGGRGIGTQLLKRSVDIARAKDYKYAVAEATNDYSASAFKKNGFEVYHTINYNEWQYPPGSSMYPYRGVAKLTGFNTLRFMVLKL